MLAQLKQHIRAECRGNLNKLMKQKITLPNAGLWCLAIWKKYRQKNGEKIDLMTKDYRNAEKMQLNPYVSENKK